MQLVSFWYDKTANSDAKIRFVAVKSSDNSYIHGYDLRDNNNYKQFLRSKIHGPIVSLGEETETTFLAGRIVTTEDLLTQLGYTSANVQLLKDLYIDETEIADLYYKKTKQHITAVGNGYFFLYGPTSVDITVLIDHRTVTMRVSEGVVEYFLPNGDKITLLDFTRMVLGVAE